jgi:hypothetical protein
VHAACGEADAARAAARAFEQAVAKLPEGLVRTLAAFQLTQIYAWIGDLDAAKAAAAKLPMLDSPVDARLSVARELYAVGNRRMRDQIIAEAVAEAKKIADPEKQARELRSIVRELAEGGDVDAAVALARQVTEDFARVDAYQNLAAVLAARGDRDAAATALAAAFDTLDARAARVGYASSSFYPSLGALAAELGQPLLARRAVAVVEKAFNPFASPASDAEANTAARIARTAAAIGDKAACLRLVAAAQKIVDRIADKEERARSTLHLAAAVARAGDKQRAAEMAARARKIHTEANYAYSEGADDLLTALVDAGDAKAAEAMATRDFGLRGEDLDDLYQHELSVHLRAAEFDAARAQAMRLTKERIRFNALTRIALRQARAGAGAGAGAGQADAVMKWVAALPEPSERAAVYLALAHQAIGIDPRAWVRGAYK